MAAKITVRWLDAQDAYRSGGSEAIEEAAGAGSCWVDVTDPDAAALELLAAPFGLHPLAVEDALHEQSRPKLDLYPEGPFLAWVTPHLIEGGDVQREEVDVFLVEKGLVTVHWGPVPAIDEVASDAERMLRSGPDWVLHGILDRMVDSLLPVVDAVGDELEDIEDRMLAPVPDRKDLDRLYALRRQLMVLHRVVAPERDILRAVARERDIVSEDSYRYFEDVGDHLLRVEDALETYRDIASAVMDIYLSAQSNRLNEIMKVLTGVTVVLGALTLISGIYGMNLLGGMWPPPGAAWAFPLAVGAMVAVAAVMSIYFRRKDWW